MAWIPFDERIVFELSPVSKKPGQHSEQGAYLSLSLDLRNGTIKGLREYGRIWKWHYAAVERFFKKIGYTAGQNLKDVARQKRDKAETLIALTNNELGLADETKPRQSRDTTNKKENKSKDLKDKNNVSPNGFHKARKPENEAMVVEYMKTLNVQNPEFHGKKFFAYYEANGWVQGSAKKPIKDWRACVRTWDLPKGNRMVI